jgi:hypothetical protein
VALCAITLVALRSITLVALRSMTPVALRSMTRSSYMAVSFSHGDGDRGASCRGRIAVGGVTFGGVRGRAGDTEVLGGADGGAVSPVERCAAMAAAHDPTATTAMSTTSGIRPSVPRSSGACGTLPLQRYAHDASSELMHAPCSNRSDVVGASAQLPLRTVSTSKV